MWLLVLPAIFQAVLMFFDEFYYHQKRDLPLWERIGHPVDTFFLMIPLSIILFFPMTAKMLPIYFFASLVSTVLVTKDEWVHTRLCVAGENWIHSLLFILHPVVLIASAKLWDPVWEPTSWARQFITGQVLSMTVFMAYQVVFWNLRRSDDQQRSLRDTGRELVPSTR